MTQAKPLVHPIGEDLPADLLAEYDLSKMGKPIRGKHAHKIRQEGYSITVHHEDGTTTTTHITPADIAQRDRRNDQPEHSATET